MDLCSLSPAWLCYYNKFQVSGFGRFTEFTSEAVMSCIGNTFGSELRPALCQSRRAHHRR